MLWSLIGRLASRHSAAILAAGLFTFLGCLTIDLVRGSDPIPEVADEYAYLLAGDTFARGRLTNPSHPLWRSLESFHILQRPTYQAKYPPGQGLFLALGSMIDRPIVGVWLSASLFISAVCWMLRAFFPPRWALLGTLTAAITMVFGGRLLIGGTPGYWTQSYWGGAVAALGGALVLGGIRRIATPPHWPASTAMGAGAVILALSRPFEGLLLCLPVAAFLPIWLVKSRVVPWRHKLVRACLPGAFILAAGLAWLLYYNWRVTGDALQLPHLVYHEQYHAMPLFTWQSPQALYPELNEQMLRYARGELRTAEVLARPARRVADYYRLLAFEAGPILAPFTLLSLPLILRSRWIVFAAGAALFIFAAMMTSTYFEVHYHAPAAPLTIILLTAALRHITLLRKRRALRALPAILILLTVANAANQWRTFANHPRRLLQHWAESRAEVNETLARHGGKHVVFVLYGPRHTPHAELVYNAADIDASPVVWLRALDVDQNESALRYFHDRTPWLMTIEDDMGHGNMTPFPANSRR